MSREKLIEGFNSLGFAYNIGKDHIPALLRVKNGEVLLTLLDPEENAQKLIEFNSSNLPNFIQFHSTEITVNLFELEIILDTLQLFSMVNTRTLRAGRAVVTISTSNYSEINGLRSRLEGFAHWVELTGVEYSKMFPNTENENFSSNFVAKPQESKELGTDFSLAATSGIQFPRPQVHQQEYTFRDIISLRTRTEELRPWNEHQRMHRMVQDLMCLAYNYPCELSISAVYREDDQPAEHIKDTVRKK